MNQTQRIDLGKISKEESGAIQTDSDETIVIWSVGMSAERSLIASKKRLHESKEESVIQPREKSKFK